MTQLSHLHVSVTDLDAAEAWFSTVLNCPVASRDASGFTIQLGDIELAVHPDWGHGETSMTLALQSNDCDADLALLLRRGARLRNGPRRKDTSINADVFGPGRLVIELEEKLSVDKAV